LSAPLPTGRLIEAVRALVLGVEWPSIPATRRDLRRAYLVAGRGTKVRVTRRGLKVLADEHEIGKREFRAWLNSQEAKEFFQR
jgi:hypothetical protein